MGKISPQESDCDLMVERVEQLELHWSQAKRNAWDLGLAENIVSSH
jgi:hypothetical protein